MLMNVDEQSNEERFKGVAGIGLYKINYEMDVQGAEQRPSYTAGIVAYTSEEAVKTLTNFCAKRVTGFKGMKIQEMGFEGLCHDMSDKVKNVILSGAIREGKAIATDAHKEVLAQLEDTLKKQAKVKKSIVPKTAKG